MHQHHKHRPDVYRTMTPEDRTALTWTLVGTLAMTVVGLGLMWYGGA